MKKFIFTFISTLLVSLWGYSQTLSSPTSQEVPVGVNGIGVSGFSLSGYNQSTTYKVSLSISGNANARFDVNTTTGLTRDFGFNSWTNITGVNFTGTPQNIENGLNSIKLNTTSTLDGLINLSVVITSQVSGAYYNPTNGHIYRFIPGQISWSSARTNAKASTFEGVPGYLVTITSADEQSFINSKVSAYNIWTGLSDETQEGYWRWMDGPEAGTVIRIGNNNVSGQYNNWAGGEPNNWASGEDYMVMKWSGGTQWNDFGPPATTSTAQIGGYIIEYGTWTDPTQSTFNSTQQTQITFTQKNIPYLTYKFNFDSDIDPTQWGGMVHYEEQTNQYNTTHTTPLTLASNGFVNATPQVFPKGPDGTKKATTVGGASEWCVIYGYDNTNNRYRVGIDKREFQNTGVNPQDVSTLQLFDLWDGNVTFKSQDTYWAEYWIYTNEFTWGSSNYTSYIRQGNGFHALQAEFTFVDNESLKNQSWIFTSKTQNEVQQLVDDIVTVSDVVLAFNELAGGGLNGGLKGDLGGIQLALGDIDRNGQFDFQDTYKMLQHLTGNSPLLDSNSLAYFMVIREKSVYEGYTKQNWSDGSWTTMMADSKMTESALVQQLQYNIGFKGDVNLSHSKTTPDVTTTSFSKSQPVLMKSRSVEQQTNLLLDIQNGDEIVVTLTLPQNVKDIVGTQFRLGFDTTRVSFDRIEYSNTQIQNFQTTRSDYLNFGSISTDGSNNLNSGMEYQIYFKPNQPMESILGLVSLTRKEVINSNGINVEMIVK
jgi:hypothetical protein